MNTDKKIKLIGTIVGVILFIILIAGISYAWFTWRSSNVNIAGNTECFTINYTNGQTLNNESAILFDETKIISDNKITIKNGMAITDVTAYIDSSCNISANLEITLNVTELNPAYISGNSVGAFKYALARYDPSVYSEITTTALNGISFDIIKNESITSTGKITLVNETLSTTEKGYLLIFYVDGDLAMNDAQYSTFTATITGIATQVEPHTAIEHITNLYINADKTSINNNSITYQYAPSVRLMNDRLGSNTVPVNGGNIRYYGKDDENLNNYIYFNCSDYLNQSSSTCEKWRIIGIVDGKVKIIRNERLEDYYYWDNNNSNNWRTSTLNTYLNGEYYNSLNTKNSKTMDLISESTYYLGSFNYSSYQSNQVYNIERTNQVGTTVLSGNPFTVEKNIGLMYASDYAYATDLSKCSVGVTQYNDKNCSGNDWLLKSYDQWLITPVLSYGAVWTIMSSGNLIDDSAATPYWVHPVLYLVPTLSFNNIGDGTSTNPYQLKVL